MYKMQTRDRTMTTIKHPLYKDFYEKGIIEIFSIEQLKYVYPTINDPFGREFVTIIYYTGARPVQLLRNDPTNPSNSFTNSNIQREGNMLKITIPPAKGGKPFTFYLNINKFGLKELWATCQRLPPNTPMFKCFSQTYVRTKVNKKGETKEYIEHSDLARYYFKKWFKVFGDNPIPPYYLRHSRFSSMSMNGATSDDIMLSKGATSFESVRPYQHMSKDKAVKLNKLIE